MRKQVTSLLAVTALMTWSVAAVATPPEQAAKGDLAKAQGVERASASTTPSTVPQTGTDVPLCGPGAPPCAYFQDFEDTTNFPPGTFLNDLPLNSGGAIVTWVSSTAAANGATVTPHVETANPFGGIGQHVRMDKDFGAPTAEPTTFPGVVLDARVPTSGLLVGGKQPIGPVTVSADLAVGKFAADFRWQNQAVSQGFLTSIVIFRGADDYSAEGNIVDVISGFTTPGFVNLLTFQWGPIDGAGDPGPVPFGDYLNYSIHYDPCDRSRCIDGGIGTCAEGNIGDPCTSDLDCDDGGGVSIFACEMPCATNADCAGDGDTIPDGECVGRIDYFQGGVQIWEGSMWAGTIVDQFAMFSDNRGGAALQGMDIDNVELVYGEECPAVCGNDVTEPGEECDGTDDGACPGRCVAAGEVGPGGEDPCTCIPICTFNEPCPLENGPNGPFIGSSGFYIYTPDTPSISIDSCDSSYDTAMVIWPASDAGGTSIGFNDDCNDGPYGAGSITTASCYNQPGSFTSCTCVQNPGEPIVIWLPVYTGADPPPGSVSLLNIDKKLECDVAWENGACCDRSTGTCTDDVPPAECEGDQLVFTLNKLCETVECSRATGACCDRTVGTCTDGVLPEDCEGDQLVWSKDELCADVDCDRATGACCDRTNGTCTDGVLPEECEGAQLVWSKDQLCADVDCAEATGACCNGLTGVCTDNVLAGACTGTQQVWSKDTSCSAVNCAAALGACCDTLTGTCTQTTQADCSLPDDVWTKGSACDDVECDPPFIPTVSEWGLVIMALLLLAGAKVYFGRREESLA